MEVENEKNKTKTKILVTRGTSGVNLLKAAGFAGNRA